MKTFIFCLLISTTSMFSQEINSVVESLNKDEVYNRVSGEPALTNTKNYITNQFKTLGLEELTDGYTDDFEVKSGLSFGDNSVSFGLIVPRMGIPMDRIKPSIQNWEFQKDWLPLGFTSDGNISEAEIAFVGYGITAPGYDDYSGMDVKDKVVIILTDSPDGEKSEKYKTFSSYEYKVKNAQKNGAVGALFIKAMGDSANVFEPVIVDKFNSGIVALQANRASLERYFPKKQALIDQEKAIRETKSPKSFILPNVKADINLQLETKAVKYSNVYGLHEGEDNNRNIIIAFPYDEALSDKKIEDYIKKQNKFYYESGNNISGIAAALELARRFKENPAPVNIVFAALSGDEPNLEGARKMVDELDEKVANSSAIFYLDNTEKIHKKHLIINSNDPLIVEKFRGVEAFKTLNAEAKELDARDTNPIISKNKKYVRVWNKLRSYPPAKREWTESDFAELNEYINLLEQTIRNLTQE
ncbi:MAG: M28 family peptidase [Candidatus Kapaibacterium sp.]